MALLIQPMIHAKSSGVMFTAHPNTGDRNTVIIHAIHGLGDRLVRGEVIPDEWLNIQDDIRCHRNQHHAIDQEEAKKLFHLAKDVEHFFGEPQDIEWSISNDGIYILQSRKITFLPERQTSMNQYVPKGFWIRETSHFPHPLKPFSLTALLPMINRAMKEMYDLIPMLIETMELREIDGYIYGRFVPLGNQDPKPLPVWVMSILSKLDPRLRKRIQACERAMEQDIHFRTIQKWYDQDKAKLMIQLDRYKAIGPADLSDKSLLDNIFELISFAERCYILHMKLNSAYSFVLGEFFIFVKELLGWESHQVLDLFYGLSSQSVEPAREINKLARWATKNPELIKIMDESPVDLIKRIEQVESGNRMG